MKESITFQHTVTIPTLNENVISKVSHLKVQPFHYYLLKLFPIFLVEKERKAKGMERLTFQISDENWDKNLKGQKSSRCF